MNRQSIQARCASLLLIGIMAMLPGASLVVSAGESNAPAFQLYASVQRTAELRPLDARTLADGDTASSLIYQTQWPQITTSTDGSTFVVVNNEEVVADGGKILPPAIVVYDGVHGAERVRIPLSDPGQRVFDPLLSSDGDRLVVSAGLACSPGGCTDQQFYVYDTQSGDRVSTILMAGDPAWATMIDPAGKRLYVPFHERPVATASSLASPVPGDGAGPWPLQIAAYDLESGEELERLTVPGVEVGSWQNGKIEQAPLMETIQPGIALSPDGSSLAVVDAGLGSLTLIDTGTFEIEAVHEVHEPEALMHRISRWLGIAPQAVQAKALEGTTLTAVFSADGQHLYVIGHEIDVGETMEDISGHGLGLIRLDLATGEITGTALDGKDVIDVMPSPDSRSVYVLSAATPWWENRSGTNQSHLLQRLDADSLESVAGRTFPDWPHLVMLAVIPETQGDTGPVHSPCGDTSGQLTSSSSIGVRTNTGLSRQSGPQHCGCW